MNPTDILIEAIRLENLMTSKGFTAAKVEISVNFSVRELTANISYKAGYAPEYKFIHGDAADGFEALISKAEEYINSLKSVHEIAKDAFIASLGRLIDQGREVGVEVDFLNPLTDMMAKLSSNIIIKQ